MARGERGGADPRPATAGRPGATDSAPAVPLAAASHHSDRGRAVDVHDGRPLVGAIDGPGPKIAFRYDPGGPAPFGAFPISLGLPLVTPAVRPEGILPWRANLLPDAHLSATEPSFSLPQSRASAQGVKDLRQGRTSSVVEQATLRRPT